MAKPNNYKQCYIKNIEERHTIPWPKPTRKAMLYKTQHCLSLLVLAMVLSDVLPCVLYYIVCDCWVWPWYCLTFFDVFWITLFVLVGFKHIEERQTILWPKPTRTNNVIWNTSKNVRQYHSQNQHDVFHIALFVLVGFGHDIAWRSSMCFVQHCFPCWFWPWYCLTFFDVFCTTLFVLVETIP
jgi:hypothetical protein